MAQVTALWVASGLILPGTLVVIINEHQVKDSVALDFMLDVLSVVKTEKSSSAVLTLLKSSGLDSMLDQLFPTNKWSPENMSLVEVSSELKQHDVGVFSLGSDKDFEGSNTYAWNENVIKNKGLGVFIASDENVLRSEMSTWFSVDQNILVEYVFMKLTKPVQVGGFVKDFCPVAVVGQKDPFKDKQIKTFHQ